MSTTADHERMAERDELGRRPSTDRLNTEIARASVAGSRVELEMFCSKIENAKLRARIVELEAENARYRLETIFEAAIERIALMDCPSCRDVLDVLEPIRASIPNSNEMLQDRFCELLDYLGEYSTWPTDMADPYYDDNLYEDTPVFSSEDEIMECGVMSQGDGSTSLVLTIRSWAIIRRKWQAARQTSARD